MASVIPAHPQTFNRYTYVTNSPLNLVDPSGMLGIPTGVGCLAAGLAVGSSSLDQQTQGLPPPPGGPVSAGPIKIDIGPVPLPEGEEPWPTTLEIIEGPNKVYNGEPLESPDGTVIDPEPYYGVGRTVNYIVLDQAGNRMTTGVLLTEEVKPTNPDAIALWRRTQVQNQPQRPDQNGILPDRVGLISPSPDSLTYLQQNPNLNATFSQTLTVYGTFGQEFRTAIKLESNYTLTTSGVTITRSKPVSTARPTK